MSNNTKRNLYYEKRYHVRQRKIDQTKRVIFDGSGGGGEPAGPNALLGFLDNEGLLGFTDNVALEGFA